ncbi:MAG: hypothetical protein Q7S87_01425 [Agitococcus sp.]|nr:hypothetical protein [Agitococcus sp.]MDO9177117.1 hypothetical protein [Agitococcus sp.]
METVIVPKSVLADDVSASLRPWFSIYNPHYGPEKTAKYWFVPFPEEEFPAMSPWEDNCIIAHYGIEPYARQAGCTETELILKLIKQSALKDLARHRTT